MTLSSDPSDAPASTADAFSLKPLMRGAAPSAAGVAGLCGRGAAARSRRWLLRSRSSHGCGAHCGPCHTAKRAGAMAVLGAASGLGMVAGPGVAGALAAHSLELLLFIAAVLPFVSLAVLWRWLPRNEHHAAPDATTLKFSDARLRRPMAVAFVAMFSVTIAQVVVGFFALDRLHLDATAAASAAGIALTVVGVALILAQLLVRGLGWPPRRLIRIGCAVSAVGFGSILSPPRSRPCGSATSSLRRAWGGCFLR